MKKSIVVVGSSNTDMVIKADHLPVAGETIIGGTFFMNPGGKGANQAVAAARLKGNVTFIAKIGNDIFGRQSVQMFKEEKINISYILSDPEHPSGIALITVDKNAENCIMVASGSNASLSPNDLVGARLAIENAKVLLVQLEIPLVTVEYIVSIAAKAGVKVILNPAPACQLPDSLLRNVSILTPNIKEAEMITGIKVISLDTAKKAAQTIKNRGVGTVIITLGTQGALVLNDGNFTAVPALSVNAIDTTGAGDVFNGALAVAVSEGYMLSDATEFACKAAAISVTRLGAQSSAPNRSEVESFISVGGSVI
jgi:ribokinase